MITILAMIFVLAVLIFVHELGHFLAARSVGVKVERFSLGFPPRLLSFTPLKDGWLFKLFFFRRNEKGKFDWSPIFERVISKPLRKSTETEYSIALIPLGGYVKMAGTIDESLDNSITGAPYELNSKNRLQQIWVMSAGVLMNLLLAVLVFAGLTIMSGISEFSNEPVVDELVPGFPAEKVGIQGGDRIVSVNGTPVSTWEEMNVIISSKPNETIEIRWVRGEEEFSSQLTTRETQTLYNGKPKVVGAMGITREYTIRDAGILESLKVGLVQTGFWLKVIVNTLGMLLTGEASAKDIGGPILIAQMAGQSARLGFAALLSFLAIISVNLAFINIIPIPGLDGGHILIITIESIIRRKLSVKVRIAIQQVGMAFLMLLILFVIYNDISRLFID